ncbi:uncharacterized protein LOC110722526 [Chenopodium quinoa]|uniref:uncharacterized protein LOC110722526 n=1 Tax=Chenopodium quinoa TaxID=63459 RepID=UPI000B77184F|nr:uncharacterized protein LOC110722526 [Chenopodium quinoa]
MVRRENIESLDLLLRDLCNPDMPFGGKVFRLTENIRAKEDPMYASFLLSLGNGQLQSPENSYVQLPEHIIKYCAPDENPVSTLAATIFPEINVPGVDSSIFNERAIITPMNEDVDAINEHMIGMFPGVPTTYVSFDSVLDDNCTIYPTEFLNSLCPGEMSPHKLELKIGSPVILLRNLAPSKGMCNGTRLICRGFLPNSIVCEISSGHYKGTFYFVPRVNLRPSASSKYPFQFERKQFPLKLSFAMTVNKSQGQTLNRVLVYLPCPCFSHGQLYVALSRAKRSAKVTVYMPQPSAAILKSSVKNIVSYNEGHFAKILPSDIQLLRDDMIMKPQYVPLDKLTPKTNKYKIKVKVKEKSPAKYPGTKKAFQKLVFEDDEGNKIRDTLFDDEIENFEHILEHEKEYIIADAPVRNTNALYRHK